MSICTYRPSQIILRMLDPGTNAFLVKLFCHLMCPLAELMLACIFWILGLTLTATVPDHSRDGINFGFAW